MNSVLTPLEESLEVDFMLGSISQKTMNNMSVLTNYQGFSTLCLFERIAECFNQLADFYETELSFYQIVFDPFFWTGGQVIIEHRNSDSRGVLYSLSFPVLDRIKVTIDQALKGFCHECHRVLSTCSECLLNQLSIDRTLKTFVRFSSPEWPVIRSAYMKGYQLLPPVNDCGENRYSDLRSHKKYDYCMMESKGIVGYSYDRFNKQIATLITGAMACSITGNRSPVKHKVTGRR